MTELKPCPFCGGEAHVFHDSLRPQETYPCRVYCDNCWAEVDSYSTEAEAIAAWNTRAERTCENLRQHGYNYLECSLCGEKSYQGDKVFDYCPNCGARVVGE